MTKGKQPSILALNTLTISSCPLASATPPPRSNTLLNNLFCDFFDLFVIVYLDGIRIFFPTPASHQVHVKKVLVRLRLHGFFTMEFVVSHIQFLGLVVSTARIEMDPRRSQQYDNGLYLRIKKGFNASLDLQTFCGGLLRTFQVSSPQSLTQKDIAFLWTPAAQSTFEQLKNFYTSAPILRHP